MNNKTKHFIIKQTGNFGRSRYIVKGFRCAQNMYKFLHNQTGFSGNQFIEHTPDGAFRGVPQKSGTYVFSGGQYQNVKNFEAWELAFL